MELCIAEPKVQEKVTNLKSREGHQERKTERKKLIKLFATVIVNHTIQKLSNG